MGAQKSATRDDATYSPPASIDDVIGGLSLSIDDVIGGLSADVLRGLVALSVLEGPISRYFHVYYVRVAGRDLRSLPSTYIFVHFASSLSVVILIRRAAVALLDGVAVDIDALLSSSHFVITPDKCFRMTSALRMRLFERVGDINMKKVCFKFIFCNHTLPYALCCFFPRTRA